jgi:glutamate-1-semialdehyde aminotransferase
MDKALALSLTTGRGGHAWDRNGHRYIDWICGYGPVVLGHGDPRVADTVHRQLLAGTLLPGTSTIEESLKERLLTIFPGTEACVFVKTGSEAVAAAIRFARAHTGRTGILRLGFHGWHDGLIDSKVGWHNWDNQRAVPTTVAGVDPAVTQAITVSQARAAAELVAEILDTAADPYAAVVIDPIQLAAPATDLIAIRQACDRAGTLLILDETKTAFRVSPGGVQELHDVRADLTIAGKALANGLPLSSVLGPADLIRPQAARIKGTFSGDRVSLAAAHAVLDAIERDNVCTRLAETGNALIDHLNGALRDAGVDDLVQAVPYRWASMPHLHAATNDPRAQNCRRAIVAGAQAAGVLLLEQHNSFVCAAHDHQDIAVTADAIHRAATVWARQPIPA